MSRQSGLQNPYIRLMRLDKPIGTFLLLYPTLWALWFANQGNPNPFILCIFVAGVFLMRAAGCVINDFADRKVDAKVKRTAQRPLATAEISPRQALNLFFALVLAAFALVLLLDWNTVVLSVVALFLAALYPFMKRYTHLPQVFLGAAFGWAIPMVYMASTHTIPLAAWLLFCANLCWVMAYDTMYAMVDRDDDVQVGIKSTAILFAGWDRFWIAVFQCSFLSIMYGLGVLYGLGIFYQSGLLIAACLSVYQQYLIYHRQGDLCFKAFLNNNLLGAVIFLGLWFDYMLA
ncbi:MAG: 4-hydroxybenzoate octaprenyltransferase [Mariprofundaceae bacterium]|nr:4-hydroxybenzoate octaprenyltransferase [Mariprofundaceae bacterium]